MTRLTNEELQKKIFEQKKTQDEDIDFNPTTDKIKKTLKGINKDFDYDFITNIGDDLFKTLNDVWFRPKYINFENFPPKRNNPKRPLIFIGNHTGMAFPWDAIIFNFYMSKKIDFGQDSIRTLTSPMLSYSTFMNPFQIPNFWNRGPGYEATFDVFDSLMHQQQNHVMIYPEGVPGIGKGFDKKYQLQQFKTSFVRMSVKYRTAIYPILTINGEYIDPYAYSSKRVNKMFNILGLPFMALGPITLLLLLQPWTFYIAFPAQLTYVLGKPIRPFDWIKKPYEDITQDEFRELADRVRDEMQTELNEAEKKYGKHPWAIGSLFKQMIKNWKKFLLVLPFLWPIFFTEFERRYQKGKRNIHVRTDLFSMLWYIVRSPIVLSYYIPILGWIPLIIRGFKGNRLKNIPKEKRIIK